MASISMLAVSRARDRRPSFALPLAVGLFSRRACAHSTVVDVSAGASRRSACRPPRRIPIRASDCAPG